MSAMIALLDRGFGRPPVAVYAQVNSTVTMGGVDPPRGKRSSSGWSDAELNWQRWRYLPRRRSGACHQVEPLAWQAGSARAHQPHDAYGWGNMRS
jgi:hypothetical protein